MNDYQEESSVYIVPQNYEERSITAGGRSIRNVIEGIVMAAFAIPVFIFLPISLMYRLMLIAVFGGGLFAFGLIGIKKCSVFEYILKIIQFSQSVKVIERNDDDVFSSFLQTKQQLEQERAEEQSAQEPQMLQSNKEAIQENDTPKRTISDAPILQETHVEDALDEGMKSNVETRKKRKRGGKRHN